jgi:hypothetical protein
MRTETPRRAERLQRDTEGELIGVLVELESGYLEIFLKPGFRFVKVPETGRIRIWDKNRGKIVELASD